MHYYQEQEIFMISQSIASKHVVLRNACCTGIHVVTSMKTVERNKTTYMILNNPFGWEAYRQLQTKATREAPHFQ